MEWWWLLRIHLWHCFCFLVVVVAAAPAAAAKCRMAHALHAGMHLGNQHHVPMLCLVSSVLACGFDKILLWLWAYARLTLYVLSTRRVSRASLTRPLAGSK